VFAKRRQQARHCRSQKQPRLRKGQQQVTSLGEGGHNASLLHWKAIPRVVSWSGQLVQHVPGKAAAAGCSVACQALCRPGIAAWPHFLEEAARQARCIGPFLGPGSGPTYCPHFCYAAHDPQQSVTRAVSFFLALFRGPGKGVSSMSISDLGTHMSAACPAAARRAAASLARGEALAIGGSVTTNTAEICCCISCP